MANELERLVDKLRAEGLRTRERGHSNYAAIFTSIANEIAAALQQAQQPSDSATEKLAAMLQGLEFQPVAAAMPASVLGTACAAIAKQAKRAADSEAQQPGAQAVAIEPEPDLDAHDPKSGELVAQWLFRNGFRELAAVVRAQLDMRAPRKAPPPLPEGVSELVRAVEWADKCEAALDAHVDIMPDEKGPHMEAWAATQIQMRRAVDDAKKRRSESCARLAAKGGGDRAG